MKQRSFILSGCFGLAIVLVVELYASNWSAGRPTGEWQRANATFRVRVTEYVIPSFPLDRYRQVIESAPAGANRWSHVVAVPGGRGRGVTPDQIKLYTERVGSIQIGNELFVTGDGGTSWSRHEFAREEGQIKKVAMAEDGQGMVWMEANGRSGWKFVLRYSTNDYGASWSRAE